MARYSIGPRGEFFMEVQEPLCEESVEIATKLYKAITAARLDSELLFEANKDIQEEDK